MEERCGAKRLARACYESLQFQSVDELAIYCTMSSGVIFLVENASQQFVVNYVSFEISKIQCVCPRITYFF